jgi:hypothetical protein
VLGDDRRSVRVDLGDREARPAQIGNLCEERVVAAGGLGSALDDVARRDSTGKLIDALPI